MGSKTQQEAAIAEGDIGLTEPTGPMAMRGAAAQWVRVLLVM
jgi:hypothetical protein